jgi:hypothetical protein
MTVFFDVHGDRELFISLSRISDLTHKLFLFIDIQYWLNDHSLIEVFAKRGVLEAGGTIP